MPWDSIHHFLDLAGVATIAGLVYDRIKYVNKLRGWIVADHKRLDALWRDHGYNGWDGTERRNRKNVN